MSAKRQNPSSTDKTVITRNRYPRNAITTQHAQFMMGARGVGNTDERIEEYRVKIDNERKDLRNWARSQLMKLMTEVAVEQQVEVDTGIVRRFKDIGKSLAINGSENNIKKIW